MLFDHPKAGGIPGVSTRLDPPRHQEHRAHLHRRQATDPRQARQ